MGYNRVACTWGEERPTSVRVLKEGCAEYLNLSWATEEEIKEALQGNILPSPSRAKAGGDKDLILIKRVKKGY